MRMATFCHEFFVYIHYTICSNENVWIPGERFARLSKCFGAGRGACRCRGLPWLAVVCRDLPCHSLPSFAVACRRLPWLAVVCGGLRCRGLPCNAVLWWLAVGRAYGPRRLWKKVVQNSIFYRTDELYCPATSSDMSLGPYH